MVPHYFNTQENLDYVVSIPDNVLWCGRDKRRGEERISRVVRVRKLNSDKRCVLESYCQDEVTVLRQACRVFRREFLQIGNIEVILESLTIASGCNKLRRRFLKPVKIWLFPTGGCTCNTCSKAIMWLLHMEQTNGMELKHANNGREYRLPELPHFSVEVYCPETNTVYEFCGLFWHGHPCQPFRDVINANSVILAPRYEQNFAIRANNVSCLPGHI